MKKNFVGCDVVELSPEIDSTGNSDVFAAKVVRELIICLNSWDYDIEQIWKYFP